MRNIYDAANNLPEDSALRELVLLLAEGMKQQDELIEHLTSRVAELERLAGMDVGEDDESDF